MEEPWAIILHRMLGSDTLNALATTGLVAADEISHDLPKKKNKEMQMCIPS